MDDGKHPLLVFDIRGKRQCLDRRVMFADLDEHFLCLPVKVHARCDAVWWGIEGDRGRKEREGERKEIRVSWDEKTSNECNE